MQRLDQDEVARLARRLREQRATLLREVVTEEADLRAIGEERESELEERAQQERITRLLSRLDDRGRRELEDIGAALDRVASGDYGRCLGCGAHIPLARLQALPATARCVRCAERNEHRRPVRERRRDRAGSPIFDVSLLDDEDVVTLVRAELARAESVDLNELEIACVRGVVHLDGALPSEGEHHVVREVVEDVVGEAVVDRIRVEPMAWMREDRTPRPAMVGPAAEQLEVVEPDQTTDIVESEEEGIEFVPPSMPTPDEE